MELDLNSRTAVVTGAGRGIGLAICEAFLAEGARVVANSLSTSAALGDLSQTADLSVVEGDVTDAKVRRRLVSVADRIDVLVNNAGIAPARPHGFVEISESDWRGTFDLDLFAAISLIREVLPVMLGSGAGVVVTVGSLNARLPDPLVIDYSAAKAALASATKSLSKAYAPLGIRFNSVDPGPVATDLWKGEHGVAATVGRATANDPEDVVRQAAAAMPTGRFSTPEEVATLVVLLSSPKLANVNGAGFVIDGGMQPTL
ncbi:SDR family NAD(P)-dependent oxidoreductase [Terrabacter sp. RAF57]|uniref:SDR family NAD(P)-dependent oxidoreductase n=1 Tax=Terrabacter sp. RAF57 TaxID=3233063 RepID=UPI003F9C1A8C